MLIDEAGLISLDKMGILFSSLRDNNPKIIVIGDDKQLPAPSNDYVATSLFRAILSNKFRSNSIAILVVMKFKGNKIAHEHIYWGQASLLAQIGFLDTNNLPVKGIEQSRKLQELMA